MTGTVSPTPVLGIGQSGYESTDRLAAAPLLLAGGRPASANASAAFLLDRVARDSPIALDDLAGELSTRFGVPRDEALLGVAAFAEIGQEGGYLSYLDNAASRWRLRRRFLADLLRLPVQGTMHLPAVRRRHLPFSLPTTMWVAAARQAVHGLLFGVTLSALVALLPGLDAATALRLGVGLTVGLTLGQLAMAPVHEVTHAAVSRAVDRWPSSVYVQGLRVGLHRRRATPMRDITVIVAGPALATLLGIALVVAVFTMQESAPTTFTRGVVTGVAVATVVHATCLVPPAADGRALVRAVLRLRRLRVDGAASTAHAQDPTSPGACSAQEVRSSVRRS
jgi:hypothetical protein